MTGLFLPDIFSEPGPIWGPTTSQERAAVRRHSGYPIHKDAVIERGARDRVNSRNYRVLENDPNMVVKHALDPDVSHLAITLARDYDYLNIPFLLRTENAGSERGTWSVWPYIPGETFQGTDQEFRGLGRHVTRLLNALRKVDEPLLPEIAGIDEERLEWCLTRPDLGPRLTRHVHEVREAMNDMDLTPVVTHIDLHPHNLLFRDGRLVAVVDTDSLRRSNYLTALGSAA